MKLAFTAAVIAAAVAAPLPVAAAPVPAIIERGPNGDRILLECALNEMPVLTEGPTDEIRDGKLRHLKRGVRKCVKVPSEARPVEAGSSGSVGLANNKRIEVVNCPAGSVPLVWRVENYAFTPNSSETPPTPYLAFAPMLVRCIEVAR